MRIHLKKKYDSIPIEPQYQLKCLFYFTKSKFLLDKLLSICSQNPHFNNTQGTTLLLNPKESIENIEQVENFFSENSDCNKNQIIDEDLSFSNSFSIDLEHQNEKFLTDEVIKIIENPDDKISYSSSCYNVYEPDLSSANSSESSAIENKKKLFPFNLNLEAKIRSSKSLKLFEKCKVLSKCVNTGLVSVIPKEKVGKTKTLPIQNSDLINDIIKTWNSKKNSTRTLKSKESNSIYTLKKERHGNTPLNYKSNKSQTLANSHLLKSTSKSKSPIRSSLEKKIDHLKFVLSKRSKCELGSEREHYNSKTMRKANSKY